MEKYMTTKQFAEVVGVKYYQISYAINRNHVPDTKHRFLGKRCFTEQDIERFRDYFQKKKQ